MFTPINEKTLELGVHGNMVEDIRTNISPNAFPYGYTIRYEKKNGLDVSIKDRRGTLVSFQYKKAFKKQGNNYWFEFNNNSERDQHNFLCRTALLSSNGNAVFYALPAFANMSEFAISSPNFLQATYLVNPLDVGPINDKGKHKFELDPTALVAHVHSESRKSVSIIKWEGLRKQIAQRRAGMNLQSIDSSLGHNSDDQFRIFLGSGEYRSLRLKGIILH